MQPKTIPLAEVRNALMLAVVRKKLARCQISEKPIARYAAYTYFAPYTSVTCRTARPGQQRRTFPGLNNGSLGHGDLDRLVRSVHLFHGAAEVRKIWGCGMRALQAEIGTGAMR